MKTWKSELRSTRDAAATKAGLTGMMANPPTCLRNDNLSFITILLQPIGLIRTLAMRSGFFGMAFLGLMGSAATIHAADYEVWVSDQANTQGITAEAPSGTHGGAVRIYDSADLEKTPPVDNAVVLDVATDLFPTAKATTGAHVARIHGILPSPDHKYMALNFVASGHLGIVDGETKRPICLFRTTGTSTGRQNHMSFWAPNGHSIIIANQNGRMLERVDVMRDRKDTVTGFDFNAAASFDLVGGAGRITEQPVAVDLNPEDGVACKVSGTVADRQATTTPTGALKQADGIRPLNTVICPIVASTSQHVFTTLGGGGMFVIDMRSTPMAIVAEYDMNVTRAAGCGGAEAAGFMHLNTGTPGPNISEFTLYRLSLDYPSAPAFNAANTPAPIAVWADADNGKVAGADIPEGNNRDAHGLVLVNNPTAETAYYLHQMDRIRNNVEVFGITSSRDNRTFQHAGSYSLTTTGACGSTLGTTKSNDPTPDLGDFSVAGQTKGRRIYVALRGPFPLTVSHAADGSCPGLGIITLSPNLTSGTLTQVLPTTVLDVGGSKNLSDPHAAIIRLKAK
ncbi:hypothetical protein [Nitrosomonas sp. Nm132]|uniref:hypothetical protein n=1 Tax=Nitrosomonas sp. Nm132 TaxID=1881053 RepID=UPI0008875B71|nr:hypothetical protein [Nitrosomonas sp. Nm132]SDH89804.1 hypothetical protein SAMN05428952_104121 [Nitrosomonas sp. Nm132]